MRYILGGILAFFLVGCGDSSGGGSYTSPSNEVIQKISARIEVAPKRWDGAPDSVESWAAQAGGRLLNREKNEDKSYAYVFRIPVKQFESFVSKVRSMGIVINEQVSLSDITKEVADIEARLRAKEEAVQRLQTLLARASTPSEILETEKALQSALAERDELRSQYENQRLLAEHVRLDVILRNRRYVGYSEGGSYWLQLRRSVEAGWEGLIYFTFFIAFLWWFWLLIGVGILIIRWWVKKRRAQKASK
ncbi:MAG: DUF4349 domain-containing protein [Bacteroidia bacterium]|nr:DUF4349 domain-containing protein [Bacteroidia bacterium]